MTLPTDYANETVSIDNHPGAHNDTNAAVNALDGTVNALDGTVAALDTRVDTLEATPASGGVSGHASFNFNATTTAPPIGSQLRINNVSQVAATTVWVMDTSLDGLDVSVGLARIVAGSQIHIQDFDDATKWVKYTVTANAVDSGDYFTITVVYHSGPANVPFQKIEFQPTAPGQVGAVGIPSGGAAGEVLAKTSGADYAVGWVDRWAGGGTLTVSSTEPIAPTVGDLWVDTT